MLTDLPDVDIEVNNRDEVVKLFPTAVPASLLNNTTFSMHQSGIYFQNIPVNPFNGFASYHHKNAEKFGFYKIDLLKAPYPYDGIGSMAELQVLLAQPINWSWFLRPDFTITLFHLGGVYTKERNIADVVAQYAPTSLLDIACLIALKMPAKRHLIDETWAVVREDIWTRDPKGRQQFKKSHAVAYAHTVGLDARRKAPGFFGA